jgi:hypothetical protein
VSRTPPTPYRLHQQDLQPGYCRKGRFLSESLVFNSKRMGVPTRTKAMMLGQYLAIASEGLTARTYHLLYTKPIAVVCMSTLNGGYCVSGSVEGGRFCCIYYCIRCPLVLWGLSACFAVHELHDSIRATAGAVLPKFRHHAHHDDPLHQHDAKQAITKQTAQHCI